MARLFRRNEEKATRKADAKREIDRLRELPIEDIAEQVMSGLGPEGPTRGATVRVQQLCGYLLRDHPGAGQLDTLDLRPAVREALELLHHAGLVDPISIQREPFWRITARGKTALTENTVRQYLGPPR